MSINSRLNEQPEQYRIIVEVSHSVDAKIWDQKVQAVSEGNYRQTTMFADHQVNQKIEECLYLRALNVSGEVVGQLLVRIGPPFAWGLRRYPILHYFLAPGLNKIAPCMIWADGPVIISETNREKIYESLISGAIRLALDRKCISVEAWPSFYTNRYKQERAWIHRQYLEKGFTLHERHTLVVDLRNEEEELWNRIKKEGRTKVRKALKQGVEIIEVDSADETILMAHNVVKETAARSKVNCWPLEQMRAALRYHGSKGVFSAFLALYEGHPVAYQNVTYFNRSAQLGGVAYSDFSRENRIYGNDLMQWHVMLKVREKGIHWLDYGGADPHTQDSRALGIYKFKAKWGGDLLNHDRFRLTLNNSSFSPNSFISRIYKKVGDRDYRSMKVKSRENI